MDRIEASIGDNLRRLRAARKLSQAEVAERARLSRVAYGKIELGEAQPRVETLTRIAQVLGVRVQELLAPTRRVRAVRFRALKRMLSREQILVEVARWIASYGELEELLDERVAYAFEGVARDLARMRLGEKRALTAAARARQDLGLAPDESLRDICGLLESRAGVKVFTVRLASDAFFGLSVAKEDGGPAVVVNAWDRISVERWIFTAAHELGHLLLHLGAYDVTKTDESRDEEEEANQFASHFLMPNAVFEREWNEARGLPLVDSVLKVKRIFRVSYRTVLYRLSEKEALGRSIWQQFQIAYKSRFGRALAKADEPESLHPRDFSTSMVAPRAADEPGRLISDDFVEDRLYRLVRAALEQELISVGRAAEILGVDLKTMRAMTTTWVE